MIFLVDYENTKANGLAGLESAHEDDVIVQRNWTWKCSAISKHP